MILDCYSSEEKTVIGVFFALMFGPGFHQYLMKTELFPDSLSFGSFSMHARMFITQAYFFRIYQEIINWRLK